MDRAIVIHPDLTPYRRIIAVSDIHGNLPFFQGLLRSLHLTREDALVLEDSENGLLAAHNGKIPAICIPDMKYPAAQYRDYAVYIAGSARDVITYFS